jgi:hypothetical protein
MVLWAKAWDHNPPTDVDSRYILSMDGAVDINVLLHPSLVRPYCETSVSIASADLREKYLVIQLF